MQLKCSTNIYRLDGLHRMQTKPTNLRKYIEPKEDIAKPKEQMKEVAQGLWTDKYLKQLYESLKVSLTNYNL